LDNPVPEHGRQGQRFRIGPQLLDAEPHLATPVGMLPSGSGHVLLGDFEREILLVDGQQPGGCLRQKARNRAVEIRGEFRVLVG
jgi:hypothetical protein